MKWFEWNEEKNKKLKLERGIEFEQAVQAINERKVLAIIPNKNHPHQQMYVLNINDYAYVVPFIEEQDKIFLKTIFPSRKYTRDFIKKGAK